MCDLYKISNCLRLRLVDKNIQSSIYIRPSQKLRSSSQLFTFLESAIHTEILEEKMKGMERQKSMEKGLLRKSLSIRERKFPNEDAFLESGLSRKSPREVKKPQNDDDECRVTASVFLSTFVAVSGSFCTGCGVSLLFLIRSRFHTRFSLSLSGILMFNLLNRLN